MFNHIMVGSNDIARSEKFYDAVLGVLGAGGALKNRSPSGHMRMFYRHDGNTFGVCEPIDGGPATLRQWRHDRLQVHINRAGEGIPRCGGRVRRHLHRGSARPAHR